MQTAISPSFFDFNIVTMPAPEPTRAAPEIDPTEGFRSAMAEHGLMSGEIIPDGRLHRFDTDKRGNKAGWYVFYPDGVPAGSFGNWQTSLKQNWCSKTKAECTNAEWAETKRRNKEARRLRDAKKAQEYAEAAIECQKAWKQAPEAPSNHPYLVEKKVKSHGLRVGPDGWLYLPLSDASGEITTIQKIPPSGKKMNWTGGKKHGSFFTIAGGDNLFICEGYATGVTVHEATGGTVYCATDAGNIPPVARAIRAQYPDAKITICADNDQYKPDRGNAGVTKAKVAAKAIGAKVAIPDFKDRATKPTDFNDLMNLEGLEEVKRQLDGSSTEDEFEGLPTITPNDCRVQTRLKTRPPEREVLISVHGQAFLPKGVVAGLAATGGTGKTKLLLSMIDAATSCRDLPPFKGKFGALILSGEDDLTEIDRRLWDTANGGPFGPNLYVAALPGEIGPLMELNDGNPVRSKWFTWLDHELCSYTGLIELLVLDPFSRFFGLEENRNEHGTAFISGLEYLAHRHSISILFACHTNEESQKKPPIRMTKTMLRGGSAISDACRLILGMRSMTDASAKDLCIEDPQSYVELDIIKTNYTPKLKSPIFFKHIGVGGFKYAEPAKEYMQSMAEALFETLKADHMQYTKRDLIKGNTGADIAKEMKDQFPKFTRSKDMEKVINWLLDSGFLKTEVINHGRNPKEILTVRD